MASFLNAYQRYGPELLTPDEVDRYCDEVAIVAEKLGAAHLPRPAEAVRAFRVDAAGARDERPIRGDLDFLLNRRHGPREERAVSALIVRGAMDLRPRRARSMLPRWCSRDRPPVGAPCCTRPVLAVAVG